MQVYNSRREGIRDSMIMRETNKDKCREIMPIPHGFYPWQVPTGWQADILMDPEVSNACIRALVEYSTRVGNTQIYLCKNAWDVSLRSVFDELEYLEQMKILINQYIQIYKKLNKGSFGLTWHEVGSTRPSKGIEVVNKNLAEMLQTKLEFSQSEWNAFGVEDLTANHFVMVDGRYFQPDEVNFTCAVLPINLYFIYEEETVGHALLAVFRMKNNKPRIDLVDGNGYNESWHHRIIKMMQNATNGGIVHMDTTAPNVNFKDSSFNTSRLAKLGIKHNGDIWGYCAFLQWTLLTNIICLGTKTLKTGHVKRLYADLLHVDNIKEDLTPWQQTIIKAYIHACSFKILCIIAEFYPTQKQLGDIGWPKDVAFPDVKRIKLVNVKRVYNKHGTLILDTSMD